MLAIIHKHGAFLAGSGRGNKFSTAKNEQLPYPSEPKNCVSKGGNFGWNSKAPTSSSSGRTTKKFETRRRSSVYVFLSEYTLPLSLSLYVPLLIVPQALAKKKGNKYFSYTSKEFAVSYEKKYGGKKFWCNSMSFIEKKASRDFSYFLFFVKKAYTRSLI